MSPSMQRYYRAQAVSMGSDMGALDDMNKVCMEINPKHPIVKELDKLVKEDKENKKTEDYARLLFDVAGLTSGYDVEDMSSFAKRVMGLMSSEVQATGKDKEKVETPSDEEEITTAEVEVV